MAIKMECSPNERLAQLALADFKLAEQAMESDPSYTNTMRFEAAKMDLNDALQLVREERRLTVRNV